MRHGVNTVAIGAAALLAVMLLGVAVPVCTMPECQAAPLAACSDSTPACPDCDSGQTVVMKHTPDEGQTATPVSIQKPVMISTPFATLEPSLVAFTVPEPEATGAPPPADPLGVRLTI